MADVGEHAVADREQALGFGPERVDRRITERRIGDVLLAVAAQRTVFDQAVEPSLRSFFYLPFEHHENAVSQARAVALFEKLAAETGQSDGLDWCKLHQTLIARFGRFPHRNAVMGRLSTPEETTYLAQGGFAG